MPGPVLGTAVPDCCPAGAEEAVEELAAGCLLVLFELWLVEPLDAEPAEVLPEVWFAPAGAETEPGTAGTLVLDEDGEPELLW